MGDLLGEHVEILTATTTSWHEWGAWLSTKLFLMLFHSIFNNHCVREVHNYSHFADEKLRCRDLKAQGYTMGR